MNLATPVSPLQRGKLKPPTSSTVHHTEVSPPQTTTVCMSNFCNSLKHRRTELDNNRAPKIETSELRIKLLASANPLAATRPPLSNSRERDHCLGGDSHAARPSRTLPYSASSSVQNCVAGSGYPTSPVKLNLSGVKLLLVADSTADRDHILADLWISRITPTVIPAVFTKFDNAVRSWVTRVKASSEKDTFHHMHRRSTMAKFLCDRQ
ncbi:uncharacterized protein BO97DRAFT_11617 [Aspergillus homomorphus CBS 101889]|uniref:Uncharacterized protein n=1 Tax=Aspergillus homomorphus (strain CBS 101889) TaxID=1450537 RepID=A0A395ICA0_ASPHC|nr:hypothetical protein BO97DRAFT_11617 [Aspergillus homomorphus CBS 101889]RAL17661.1 hypothetical protein BO97DRAFT_11617 [Aspergillus homomorphus CBS 101889]